MHTCERCGTNISAHWSAIRYGLQCDKWICDKCEFDYIAVRDIVNLDIPEWIEYDRPPRGISAT